MKHIVKKVLFFLLIAVVGKVEIRAQNDTYEKILKTDSTSWVSYHRELFGPMKDCAYVKNSGDSHLLYIIYGIGYLTEEYFVGNLREEDGRLWITYSEDPDNEYLLMDMNLEVGDEFVFDMYNNITANVIEIRYENGRKIIVFDQTSVFWFDEPFMFIEGVGRNVMTFDSYGGADRHYQSCKFDNEELIYSTDNQNFENCEYQTLSVNSFSEKNTLEIYPIPAQDEFVVNLFDSHEPYIISIFNSNGVLVKTEQCNKGKNTFSSENLKNGIYIVKAFISNKVLYNKLVINK